MTTTCTLELPFPPSALRPNAHRHPGTHRIAREYGGEVWTALREQLGPPPTEGPTFRLARLDIVAVYPDGRWHWDSDAVVSAMRSAINMMREFGLFPDDKPAVLTIGSVTATVDRTRTWRVLRVTLTEAGREMGDRGLAERKAGQG